MAQLTATRILNGIFGLFSKLDATDETLLKKLLEEHNRWTGSKRARELLDDWAVARTKFVKVFPNEYKRALGEIHDRKVELASSGNNAHVGLEPHAVRTPAAA